MKLPDWFYRLSPLTMDALIGPDEQYHSGARDMLEVLRSHPELLFHDDSTKGGNT
jgi:hypothetical protein